MGRAVPHADIHRSIDAHGTVWFNGQDAVELLLRGFDLTRLFLQPTAEITAYNQLCARWSKTTYQLDHRIARDDGDRTATWSISEPFRSLPVTETLLARCGTERERARVTLEMAMFEARGLIPVLRLMFMLVEHFRTNNIVWGAGRGSSVASYVLFLIGVHKIDALYYDLDIKEFLKE